MNVQQCVGWLVVGIGVLCTSQAQAVEFAVVGARAAGMGGAGVAVTSDAYAAYWNPAGLAMTNTIDIRVGASFQVIDRVGVNDTLNEIDKIDLNNASASNQARL